MLKAGERYTVSIDDINIFGNGVCRIDGMAVFVEGGIVGEKCEIEIMSVRSKYGYAKAVKILTPSVYRVESLCPHFGVCGGCAFGNIDIELENEIKERYVKSAFFKQGIKAEFEKIICPVSQKYRNKAVLFCKNGKFGYMKKDTNIPVPHTECLLNPDVFEQIVRFTEEKLKRTSVRALYMRKTSHVDPKIMVCVVLYKEQDLFSYVSALVNEFPGVATVMYAVNSQKDFALEGCRFKTLYGEGYITDSLCGLNFRISAESFYQVNHTCAGLLYEKAISLANLDSSSTVADLFCGTGTIGIITAHKTGATVYGVEIIEKAVKDAIFNARANGIVNAHFEAKDASLFNKHTDTCIIDPPRKGCSSFMIDTIKRLKPKKIVYISCNADTMVRDIKLLEKEYKISHPVSIFNLFPRTSHQEVVALLTRVEG